MKLSLEQFNKLVSEVTSARQLQRGRNEQKALEEELQKEDIQKLQRQVLKPVLEEAVASPLQNVIKNLKKIEGRPKQLEAIEASSNAPSEVVSTSAIPVQNKPLTEETLPLVGPSVLRFDPDKGMDIELLNCYKFLKPSEIIREEEPQELVAAYITDIDYNLKSWGGRIAKIQDKDLKEYKQLRRKIDGLRAYKDRIKDLLKALPLAGGGDEAPEKREASSCCPKGRILNSMFLNPIEYKYYSSPDELINRLELLCAERDIGNDSTEVRNEIMAILDILLKSKIIDKVDHEEMFRKWCY
jgi:hypothetical protein